VDLQGSGLRYVAVDNISTEDIFGFNRFGVRTEIDEPFDRRR
jgi:hypothetical protein